MRDSVTYMAILEEGEEKGRQQGRIEELRKMILRLGERLLRNAPETAAIGLAALNDIDRLEFLCDCLTEVKTWQDLFASP